MRDALPRYLLSCALAATAGCHANDDTDDASQALVAGADLVIEGVSVYASRPETGHAQLDTVSFRVRNNGMVAIAVPFRTQVLGGATPLYVTTPGLASNESVFVSQSFAAPAPGALDVVITTDFDGAVVEASEANNVVHTSVDGGNPAAGQWVSIGPRAMSGTNGIVGAIAVDRRNAGTLYASGGWGRTPTGGGGIWKTTDTGTTWRPVADSLPTLGIYALGVDAISSRVYAATTVGFYASDDGGASWRAMSGELSAGGGRLALHPTVQGTLYMTTPAGLRKTTDGGRSFTTSALPAATVTDVAIDPTSSSRLWATLESSNEPSAGVFQTTTGGTSWTKLLGCAESGSVTLPAAAGKRVRVASAGSASAGSVVYVGFLAPSPANMDIYRSTGVPCTTVPGQTRWQRTQAFTTVAWDDAYVGLYVDPSASQYVFATGLDIYRSADSGTTWGLTHPGHVDQHAMAFDAAGAVYAGNDGSVYRSTDHGAAWSFLGNDLRIAEFYSIAVAHTDGNVVVGGTQDNGNRRYDATSLDWAYVGSGDGATADIDPGDPDRLYLMGQYAQSIYAFQWPTGALPCISCGLPSGAVCFNMFFQVDPIRPTTLLASCQGSLLQRDVTAACTTCPTGGSLGAPTLWTPMLTVTSGAVVRSAVDPSGGFYYAGTSTGEVRFAQASAPTSWTTIFSAGASIADIDVDDDDPATVYVATAGSGASRIYRLRRSGASFAAPVPIAGGLPSPRIVSAVAVDRMNPTTIYVASFTPGAPDGWPNVWRARSSDGGATWSWSAFSNGLPAAANVVDLKVHPRTGILRAATMGRGVFEVAPGPRLGSVLAIQGVPKLLRVNEVGDRFGPADDFIDAEVEVKLDHTSDAYGFQLRNDAELAAHRKMFAQLRDGFKRGTTLHLDYIHTGLHNNQLIRVYRP